MKVIFYNIFGLGHINPTLPLITSLVEAGHTVIYHSSPERKDLIEACGAEFRNYGRDDYKAADYNPGKNFVLQTLPATLGLLPFLQEEIIFEKPDLLIYDSMAPWGKLLSHIFKLPAVCTVTTLPLTSEQKLNTFAQHGVKPDELNLRVLREIKEKYELELNFDCVLGAYNECNLVFSIGTLNPNYDLPSQHFHFIGAPSRKEDSSYFPIQTVLMNSRKVITMALGTLLPEEDPVVIDWYRCLIDAFSSDKRFQIVISTGNKHNRDQLGQLSPNIYACDKIPQLEVLKFTSVFIHHGGMNSITEGMAAGVPMIIIPHSKDQLTNAVKVQELEIGLTIKPEELNSTRLRKEVLNLMFSPRVKHKVMAIQQQFHDHRRSKDALSIIQERALEYTS